MTFGVYVLRCADGSYYTGQSDNPGPFSHSGREKGDTRFPLRYRR